MKYWITKWALTRGAIVVDSNADDRGYVYGHGYSHKVGVDAFTTEAEARIRIAAMVMRKLKANDAEQFRLRALYDGLAQGGPLPADKRAKETKP